MGIVQIVHDKEPTTLSSTALVAYPVYVVLRSILAVTQPLKVEKLPTLLGFLPVKMRKFWTRRLSDEGRVECAH